MKSISEISKNKKMYILSLAIVFVLGLLLLMLFTPSDNLKLKFGGIYELNDEWTIEEPSGEIYMGDLPDRILVNEREIIHLSKVLPTDFNQGRTIRMRSSMQKIQVELDGINIFDNTLFKQNSFPYTPEASYWILIDIPKNHENSVLDIFVSSDISIMNGRLNEIYYGSRGDLIGELITKNAIGIFIVLFVFAVAIFSFLTSLTVNMCIMIRIKYLSLFSFSIGVWLLSEMDLMQLLFSHNYLVGTISYLILPVATIMFVLFIYEVALKSYWKILKSFVILNGMYLMVAILLQLFFGIDYIQIWPVFMVLLAIIVLTIIILLVLEIRKKSVTAAKYLSFIFVFFTSVVAETMMFLIGEFDNVSSLSSIGIMIFLLLVIIDTIKYLGQSVKNEAESKYLRDIAYTDPLTKGLNRAAFERDVDNLLMSNTKSPFRLTMFDMNELKQINDIYGHEVGDQALKDFYDALIKAFDQDASCYRIGGDEFMVIHINTSEGIFRYSLKSLQSMLKQREKFVGYLFEAAYGTGIYKFKESFGDFKHYVDLKMYNEKGRQKEVNHSILNKEKRE